MITRSVAQNPYPTTHLRQRAHTKQQSNISENRQGDGPAPGSLPGTNVIQLNGSPHDGRRRRSDGLFQRPGSHSRVRRTTRTPAGDLSTRLDDDDDDHVDSLDTAAGRRPRFRFVPATEQLSLRLLPTTATSLN